jgi:ATP-dependent RNA helicase DDX21
MFQEAAETLLAEVGVTPVQALAKALAKIAGHTEIKQRSLLTSHEDSVTLHFKADSAVRTPT